MPSQCDSPDSNNDVAVIGMACRVAGGNNTPEQLWQTILSKTDTSSEIPAGRWEPYLRRDARNAAELKKTTSRGYFLDNLEGFDAAFFGISPMEAEQIDPQQRIALEVAWEALEDAGLDPRALAGSDTAVFMGVNSDDYSKLLLEDLPNVDAWMGIGTAYCGVPNRISYHLDLMGPSTAVDAACASSLVAIHHARQAILTGESTIAIAGGVNALCGPGLTRVLDKAGATSPEGSCLSFDERAHGYGRGEGAAVVVLKNLGRAVRDGDNIVAVLKGSAVAQDGKTNGIMAPNAKAQELVARQALRQADIDAATIEYVEAHATSTPLGDPTEISAIAAVYGYAGTSRAAPVAIGSVKPNVGHLEAGAGAVGFIKAILAVNKGTFPPQANLQQLNSKVNWAKSGTCVVSEAAEWQEPSGHRRRAAICSYGYGGTVSHAIIEQPQPQYMHTLASTAENQSGQSHSEGSPVLVVLSAPQEKRLKPAAMALAKWLSSAEGREQSLEAIANTLALRRAQHTYRATFVVHSHDHAAETLTAFVSDSQPTGQENISQDAVLGPSIKKDVVWIFSGHGAQWDKMGSQLIHNNAAFLEAVQPLDRITRVESGFSAIEALQTGDFVDKSDRVQVMTYIIQVGLAAVLFSKGVRPSAIIGHSVGEIAATVAAGSLSPEEGMLIVTRRAELYRSVQGQGAMFLVGKSFEDVRSELGGDGDVDGDVVAAIHSSPSSSVVSGRLDAVVAYAEKLKSRGTKVMRVSTDIAFHSRAMLSPLSVRLLHALVDAGIQPKPPTVPLYSTSDADPRTCALRGAQYWVQNMVEPVFLTTAVRATVEDGFRLFLEVSSHPIVAHSVSETLTEFDGIEDEDVAVVATMRRNKPTETCIMQAIGALYVKGAGIDFRTVLGRQWSPRVPGTQWLHKNFWRTVESGASVDMVQSMAGLVHQVDKHTLLGLRSPIGGTKTVLYTTSLDDKSKPFPGSHPLHGTEIVPAAVLINTFHHATGAAATLSNITLRVPVAISAPRDIQVVVDDERVTLSSRLRETNGGASAGMTERDSDHSWVTHTTGYWSKESHKPMSEDVAVDIEATKTRINAVLPPTFSIEYLAKVGVSAMGFPWAITEHYGNLHEMIARVDVAPDLTPEAAALPWDQSSWAPVLDAATSVGSTIFFDNPKLRMPAQIGSVHFFAGSAPPPKTGWLYIQEASEKSGGPAVHVSVCNDEGRIMAKFESMRFSEIEGTPGVSGSVESLTHRLAWVPAPLCHKAAGWEKVVLVSDDEEIRSRLGKQLGRKLRIGTENISELSTAAELAIDPTFLPIDDNTAIIYCPGPVSSLGSVAAQAEAFVSELLTLTKRIVTDATTATSKNIKIFALTKGVSTATTTTGLAHAPLQGLARIIASEHPDQWGALIDVEDEEDEFPVLAVKYVRDQDVVRVQDQLPRVARLQPLPRELLYENLASQPAVKTSIPLLIPRPRTLLPRPEGTYLITGGLGALGLEVTSWLVAKGARRIVLVSRRRLPSRKKWASLDRDDALYDAVVRVQELERGGATVFSVSLDIGGPDAQTKLRAALEKLALPPVLGVVHAAGTIEDQLVRETTGESVARVLAPKVSGALALDGVFPVGTLDWLVLFSSCGQLLGFPGQSSYASGNAFLDAMATRRRAHGENAVAFQWTSWRGLGMAAGAHADFINAELESKGITDITVEEGFRAWEHVAKYDIDHGVVLRSLAFDEGEALPVAILENIAVRRSSTPASGAAETEEGEQKKKKKSGQLSVDQGPEGGPGLKAWILQQVREVIANVLMLSGADEVDPRAATADLGVDSVITVTLRRQLQAVLKVKVPPTLTWSHPTANHLTAWFMEKLSSS
ncbi:unnamed protein product [Discula destructiva]